MIGRRSFLVGLAGVASPLLVAKRGRATTVRPVSLAELTQASRHVLVGVPVESFSQWETIGDARRIVTYSRVLTRDDLDGSDPEAELLVRTLGGRVGDIAQLVHGEARLKQGDPNALFVHQNHDGTLVVTAMAQGEFPLQVDQRGVERLERSPALGDMTTLSRSAVLALDGRDLVTARRLIREAKQK